MVMLRRTAAPISTVCRFRPAWSVSPIPGCHFIPGVVLSGQSATRLVSESQVGDSTNRFRNLDRRSARELKPSHVSVSRGESSEAGLIGEGTRQGDLMRVTISVTRAATLIRQSRIVSN